MKERPILFSAPMVRALLNDAKTQTRRVMKVQPDESDRVTVEHFYQTVVDRSGEEQPGPQIFGAWWADGECGLKSPYGQPGDRLWVREAWAARPHHDETKPSDIPKGHAIYYRADEDVAVTLWRPSIFMPRWASRITLEVTGVRVERLNDISEADAVTEGVDMQQQVTMPFSQGLEWCTVTMLPRTAREAYMHLWESINGPGSWALNPWVWVVEFKRLTDQAKGE